MTRKMRSSCPIYFALDIFGDKWTLLILRDLLLKDKKHYEDFVASDEKISTNILADRLKKLKKDGLVRSRADKLNGRKIIYAPTPKALDLIPMILEIIDWSAKYGPETGASKELIRRLRTDRRRLAFQVRSKFER